MADDVVVRATNVSKKFCRSLKHVMLYGAKDIARNMVGLGSRSEELRSGEFWAVDDASFELRRGKTLGLIGPNGSGKSTLLKMLNGIFMPDKGKIEIKGRVGALIEVGAGFHPMLTGRENIYINGSILGMRKKEIDKKFDEIVDFADIDDFIDAPVKHYSSGMFVRLGFSIAVHSEPEILLVDEVLSVGDISFRAKSIDKIREIQRKNSSIIFVSHNLHAIAGLCEKTILCHKGKVRYYGDSEKAIEYYYDLVYSNSRKESKINALWLEENSDKIKILNVTLGGKNNKNVFSPEDSLFVTVEYEAYEKIPDPIFGFAIRRSDNTVCCISRSKYDKAELAPIQPGRGKFSFTIEKIQLTAGAYILDVIIFDSLMSDVLSRNRTKKFTVTTGVPLRGVFFALTKWHN